MCVCVCDAAMRKAFECVGGLYFHWQGDKTGACFNQDNIRAQVTVQEVCVCVFGGGGGAWGRGGACSTAKRALLPHRSLWRTPYSEPDPRSRVQATPLRAPPRHPALQE